MVEASARLLERPVAELAAETFDDSVGIGSYRIDLHMRTAGDNYIDVASLRFKSRSVR